MAKAIKLKNNTFIDSKGVVHDRQLLSDILTIKKYTLANYLVNSWSTNGANLMFNFNGIKVLVISIRYGTANTIIQSLPNDMKPINSLLAPANDQHNSGWVSINKEGSVTCSSNLVTSQTVQCVAVYY